MISLYTLFLILGIAFYFLARNLNKKLRIIIAILIFIVPSIIATIWIIQVGDKPPPDAITIYPKSSE